MGHTDPHPCKRLRQAGLSRHHLVIYGLIADRGRITARTLHRQYDTHAEAIYRDTDLTPLGKRSRRNKLQDLTNQGLIRSRGRKRGRVYQILPPSETQANWLLSLAQETLQPYLAAD